MVKSFNIYIRALRYIKTTLLTLCVCAFSSAVFANPVLDNVAHGNVTVQQTQTTTTINQQSQKAILNWQSFNIAAPEHTHFNQPTNGIALNRINPSQGVSQIYGRLTATGKIILVNPAGFHFGPSSYVNVGGLIASTANISNEDFLNSYYRFTNDTSYNGSISTQGQIIAADHGLIALVGGAVTNDGYIQANMGHAILASGDAFTISLAGNDLIHFSVDTGVTGRAKDYNGNDIAHGVKNTGLIMANGGNILVSARAASGVLDTVINMQGIAQARSIYERQGSIIISGDPNSGAVEIAGKLDASGKDIGQVGGRVEITGHNILLTHTTEIEVSGDLGAGNVNIGGNYLGLGPLPNANAVIMEMGAEIMADAISAGDGGRVILWSDYYTNANGLISAVGGALSGDGGFVETSSANILSIASIIVDTSAAAGEVGTWLLDPFNVVISAVADLNVTYTPGSPSTYTPSATGANILNTNLQTNLNNSNVTVRTSGGGGAEAGNVTVNAPVTWTSSNTFRIEADGDININAAISGFNGTLELQAQNAAQSIQTGPAGDINVKNFALDQGQWFQVAGVGTLAGNPLPDFNVSHDFSIDSGALPTANAQFIRASSGNGTVGTPYTIVDEFGLQGIASNSSLYALYFNQGADIDAYSTRYWNNGAGFVPIGDGTTNFSGFYNGQDYAIDGLYINMARDYLGLFGRYQAPTGQHNTIRFENINLTNFEIHTSGTRLAIGGLIGHSHSTGEDNYVSGKIVVDGDATRVGGMFGLFQNNSFFIRNSHADVDVIVGNGSTQIGGFVGFLGYNRAINSSSAGSVTVNGDGSSIGGFAGLVTTGTRIPPDSIIDDYSITDITISGNGTDVGGFVGQVATSALVRNSYATGRITIEGTETNVGGFVGRTANNPSYPGGGPTQYPATVQNSFWDTQTTGYANGVGLQEGNSVVTNLQGGTFDGSSGVNLTDDAVYSGASWSITNVPSTTSTPPGTSWFIFESDGSSRHGKSRPMLVSEQKSKIRNARQLQMMGSTLDGSYTLENDIYITDEFQNTGNVWGTDTDKGMGNGFIPIGYSDTNWNSDNANAFDGTLNGNGHVIDGLYMNYRNAENGVLMTGLFGGIKGNANVTQLGVTNVDFTGNNGVAGLVALMYGGTVSEVYTSGAIKGADLADPFNMTAAGGFVGQFDGGSITNSYSTTSVDYIGTRGAFGGWMNNPATSLTNSYASGHLKNGGVGFINRVNGTISGNYFDTQSTGTTSSGSAVGVAGLTTAQMMQVANFPSLSITSTASGTATPPANTWFLFPGATRPMLLMEHQEKVTNAHQLQLMGAVLDGDYSLQNNIDLAPSLNTYSDVWAGKTVIGFNPIGESDNTSTVFGTEFTGHFDGRGHTISNLYVNRSVDGPSGFFGAVAGSSLIENLSLTDIDITDRQSVGGLIGNIKGSSIVVVRNIYVSGSVIGGETTASRTTGGVIGSSKETVTAIIHDIYSTASVHSRNDSRAGGIIGVLNGISSVLSNAYASGAITKDGTGWIGGIAAQVFSGSRIENSFWDTDTTGQYQAVETNNGTLSNVNGGCFTGSCVIQPSGNASNPGSAVNLSQRATYNAVGWDISNTVSSSANPSSNTWFIFEDKTRPMLMMEYSTDISNPHQLQLAGAALGANYKLVNDIDLSNSFNNEAEIWGTDKTIGQGEGFMPIGLTTAFSGAFDGQDHDVKNLYIDSSETYAGLFGNVNSTNIFQDIHLVDVDITNFANNGYTAGLFGNANGAFTVRGVSTTGDITGVGVTIGGGNHYVGGIAGEIGRTTGGGVIEDSYSFADVHAVQGQDAGGLVGSNFNDTIRYSYFAGKVTGTGVSAGGITGATVSGSISDSYNVGTIDTGFLYTGGISGYASSATISNIYNSGFVRGIKDSEGGVIGWRDGGGTTLTNAYFDSDTSNQTVGVAIGTAGGTALSSTGMNPLLLASYAFPSITSTRETDNTPPTTTWFIFNGDTRPILMSEFDYTIRTPHQVQLMGSTLGASYKLHHDIDMSALISNASEVLATNRNYEIGKGFLPVGDNINQFTGGFDGNSYTIDNLYIDRTNTNLGLFGYVNTPNSLGNVRLTNIDISLFYSAEFNIGSFIGRSQGGAIIDNVMSSGNISASRSASSSHIGGIVGHLNDGRIMRSYSVADIVNEDGGDTGGITARNHGSISETYFAGTINTTGNFGYAYSAGGISGGNFVGATISNSYNAGTVQQNGSGTQNVGGIAGFNTGSISNTYNSGRVAGNDDVGGIVGQHGGTLANNFWDTQTTNVTSTTQGCGNVASCAGTTGNNTAAMMTLSTFTTPGWDITATPLPGATSPAQTWFIFNGATRPMLTMEHSSNIHNAHELQMTGSALGADYTLANDIDLISAFNNTSKVWATDQSAVTPAGSGFVQIGATAIPYSGTFDGNDYEISNLYMNQVNGADSGMFAAVSGDIKNLKLTDVDVAFVNWSTAPLVGALQPTGSVSNVYVSGDISSTSNALIRLGGIVGVNQGHIVDSISDTDISLGQTSTGGTYILGGIAGWNHTTGRIERSFSRGHITAIPSTAGINYAGGVVGENAGAVVDTYSMSRVIAHTGFAGGLVGVNQATGSVDTSYSSGEVLGYSASATGGLSGSNAGSINNSYWDMDTSGQATSAGGTGLTTAQSLQIANYGGFDISNSPSSTNRPPSETWFIFENGTRPILMMEYSQNLSNPHELQLIASTKGADYTLANNIDLAKSLSNTSEVWATNKLLRSGEGFVPIGDAFGGSIDGMNYEIRNIYMNRTTGAEPTNSSVAFIAQTNGDGFVRNLGLTDIDITFDCAFGCVNSGVVVGVINSTGTFENIWTSGQITGAANTLRLGGVFGAINRDAAVINNVHSAVNITATEKGSTLHAGGIVAYVLRGTSITNSSNTGNIVANSSAGTQGFVGGAFGEVQDPNGTITMQDNYSLGDVTHTGNGATTNFATGGFIGKIASTETISRSYSTGVVTATDSLVGGFAGLNQGSISASFWDAGTSGFATGVGSGSSTGLTGGCFGNTTCTGGTVDLSRLATYTAAGWTDNSIITNDVHTNATPPNEAWFIFDGFTRPILMAEWSETPRTPHAVQLMATTLDGNFVLDSNVNFDDAFSSKSEVWGTDKNAGVTGQGFVPIGVFGNEFDGRFDGQGYAINNLYINLSSAANNIGLFGVSQDAYFKNIAITNADLTRTAHTIGASAGILLGQTRLNSNTIIRNVFTSGSINSTWDTGGIVGGFAGTSQLSDAYNTASVHGATAAGGAGGVIGSIGDFHTTVIDRVYSTGLVTTSSGVIGGLIGYSNSPGTTISNSLWDANTSGRTNLIGLINSLPIINNTTSGCFSGVGCAAGTANLSASSTYTSRGWDVATTASSTSSAPENTWFMFEGSTRPILSMEHKEQITNSHQLQMMGAALNADYTIQNDIDLSADMNNTASIWGSNAGSLVERGFESIGDGNNPYTGFLNGNGATINGLYMRPDAVSNGSSGLISVLGSGGRIDNIKVTDAQFLPSDTGLSNAGILVGHTHRNTVISHTYTSGTINPTNVIWTGGLVGQNHGVINTSLSDVTINVTCPAGGACVAGGLTGTTYDFGSLIDQSYSRGSITLNGNPGTNTIEVGGLTGELHYAGTITNSYSQASVSGTTTGPVLFTDGYGGLVGGLQGANVNIDNSYSIGYVAGDGVGGVPEGGLIGVDNSSSGSVTNSFYDIGLAGQTVSAAGTGESMANMMSNVSPATYAAWDMTETWNIVEDQTFPYLRAFYSNTPRAVSSSTTLVGATNVDAVIASNGTVHSTVRTGGNGAFYDIFGVNDVSGIDNSILDGAIVLAYLDSGGTAVANTIAVAPLNNGSLSGTNAIDLKLDTVTAGSLGGTGGPLSNADLNTAKGALFDTDIIYSYAAGDITVDSGNKDFATPLGQTYNLDGDIIARDVDIDGPLVLSTANPTIDVTGTASEISGVISGANNLVKEGTGTLELSGANTYTGRTIINGGVISVSAENNIGATPVTFDADHLTLNGGTFNTQNGITLSANRGIFVDAAGGTLDMDPVSPNTIYDGVISGTGDLTFDGGGTTRITAINTYTGKTIVKTPLVLNNDLNFGPVPASFIADAITIDNGNLTANSADVSLHANRGITLAAGGARFRVANARTLTLNGVISGTGNIVKVGVGSLAFTGNNTFVGSTSIDSGELLIGADANMGNVNNVIVLNGGNLHTTSGFTVSPTRGITLNGTVSEIITNGSNLEYSGNLITGPGELIKSGSRELLLYGDNTYTGKTRIRSGVLTVDDIKNVGGGASSLGAPTTIAAGTIEFEGGRLKSTGTGTTTDRNMNVTVSGGYIDIQNINHNYSGDLTLNSNTFGLFGSYGGSGEYSGTISGSAASTLNMSNLGGVNGWTLSGANNAFDGSINVNNNVTVTVASINALGSNTGATNINSGGTLNIDNIALASEPINLNTGSSLIGLGTASTAGPVTTTGTVSISTPTGTDSLLFNGTVNGAGDVTISGPGDTGFAGSVGGITPLSSITVNAGGSTTMNTSNVATTGNQTYNSPITFGADTLFSIGSGAQFSSNAALTGPANNITVTGIGSNLYSFVDGPFNMNSITVTGNGSGNNLAIDNNATQLWNITAQNSGDLLAINLSFTGIQSLTGNNFDNTFVFANGAGLDGVINGFSLVENNLIDFTAYLTSIDVRLATTNSGTVYNNLLAPIGGFNNITTVNNNPALTTSKVTLPSGKAGSVTMTAPLDGFINDPIFFNDFFVLQGPGGYSNTLTFNTPAIITNGGPPTVTAIVGGLTMTFINFSVAGGSTPTGNNIAQIILQPDVNVPETGGDNLYIDISGMDGDTMTFNTVSVEPINDDTGVYSGPICYKNTF